MNIFCINLYGVHNSHIKIMKVIAFVKAGERIVKKDIKAIQGNVCRVY